MFAMYDSGTLQLPQQDGLEFFLFCFVCFNSFFWLGGCKDTKAQGDEWDWGALYEIHKKKSIKSFKIKMQAKL